MLTREVESYAFQPHPQSVLPIRGSKKLFPIHRVYCVGRNYADHAKEMGHDAEREPPFFFQKNPGSVVTDGVFPYPPLSSDVHHETELVVALSKGGSDIDVGQALDHVFGYAVGLDMTRRDLQTVAKQARRPWETSKAFEASAPCSPLVPVSEIGHPGQGRITLRVNGALRQDGNIDQMIWNVPETIAYLSTLFTLRPGDLIFTGTPAGVAAVVPGDRMEASIEHVGELRVDVR